MNFRNFSILLIITLTVLAAAALSAGCTSTHIRQVSEDGIISDTEFPPVTDDNPENKIMPPDIPDATLEEKIGQMLMIGFRGYTADNNSKIADDIKEGRIGGVILFDHDVALDSNGRNIRSPEQVGTLNQELQSYALPFRPFQKANDQIVIRNPKKRIIFVIKAK